MKTKIYMVISICTAILFLLPGCGETSGISNSQTSLSSTSLTASTSADLPASESTTAYKTMASTKKADVAPSKTSSPDLSGATKYTMKPNLDYGSFDSPHKLGETVRVAFSVIPQGETTEGEVDINVTIEQFLSGSAAIKKLKEFGPITEDDQRIIDYYDVYVVKYKTVKNKATFDGWTHVSGANKSGEDMDVDLIFSYTYSGSGFTRTDTSEEGWTYIIAEKGDAIKPALFVGSNMEAPGIVATFYFDTK